MPTKIGDFRRKYQSSIQTSLRSAKPITAVLMPPWPGWEPDLDSGVATPGAATTSVNCIDRDGTLTLGPGFSKVDSASQPLDGGDPVVGLGFGFDQSGSYPGDLRRFAVTTTKLYELVTGTWTERVYTNTTATGTLLSLTAADLTDIVYFAAGDYIVICTGPDQEGVYKYPDVTSGNEYTEAYDIAALNLFKAQAACVHEERLVYINTNEGGSFFRNRVRWTSKGANATIDETVVGSGCADLYEFYTPGLRVLPIGEKLACYFGDGVQFLRLKKQATDPYERDYVTHEHGLLGTRSVTPVGASTHFGIFTDGWYAVNSNGQWQEAGTLQTGKGDTYHKWKRTFYGLLNWEHRERTFVEWDPQVGMFFIGAPTGSSDTPNWFAWYDPNSDRLWPQDISAAINCTSRFQEVIVAGESWDSDTGAWDLDFEPWDADAGIRGAEKVAFGTTNGLVFQFKLGTDKERDGTTASWLYMTHYYDGGTPHTIKRWNKLNVGYRRSLTTTPNNITASYGANETFPVTSVINPDKGDPGSDQTDFVSGASSGERHRISLAGSGDFEITRLAPEILPSESPSLDGQVA